MSGREIPFSSPRGLLLAGTGDVDFIEVYPAEPRRVDDVRQVPEPPARQAQRKASDEQIHEIIMDRRRKACVFSIRIATDADPTTRGRVGGLPLLPSHVDWPRAFKKPLPFLAQLPLDPLQELDSNLEPFEPGSLLTIFWGQDWWSPHPGTHGAPVFIVAGDVQERVAPDPDLILPRRSLEVVVIEEVPCWSEMQEILKMELSDPDPKRLRQFHESRWKDYPAAREATKVGGWPHWVQSPDSENPLVAQLHSEDEADLMLGDAGSLYILQRDDRSLEVLMQCY
ncbi:MAG: DUF1963 domain-containing protein, partial [Pirellulales bacterium]|nr:DUF1963 domain-containing protein [Pirellulales bacterium]